MKPISFESFSGLMTGFVDGTLEPDWHTLVACDLLRDKTDFPWRDRLYRRWRSKLAAFRLARPYVSNYDWSPALKHVPHESAGRALVIWAVGVGNTDLQRSACQALRVELRSYSGLLPVLLTDCADFSFYSRLGWQVEYLPALSGEGEDYQARKCAYLAWRYRDALVLPLGTEAATRLKDMAGEYSMSGLG